MTTAWAISALVTWGCLALFGARKLSALRLIAIAWGAQVAVVVASWLAENAILALFALRN